jgi:S1-C subfamily serine protease
MPDFAWTGGGVRVQQVMPGSAAERAGLEAGDVITAIDGEPVGDLREYSALLKAHAPGDEIEVAVVRDGEELVVSATLGER